MKAKFDQNRAALVFWGATLVVFLVQLRAVVNVTSGKIGLPINFDKAIVIVTVACALWIARSESAQSNPNPLQMEPALRIVGLYLLAVVLSYLFAEIPPNSIGATSASSASASSESSMPSRPSLTDSTSASGSWP